jgi:hypothetical protein
MAELTQSRIQLRQFIDKHFNDEDLRNLCFELTIDYESLGGEGRSGKVRELIAKCERNDRLKDLVNMCCSSIPNVPQEELDALIKLVAPNVPSVLIPVVVIAMTQQHLRELWSESAFSSSESYQHDRKDFRDVKSELHKHEIDDLTHYYGDSPDDWIPIAFGNTTVKSMIEESVERFNAKQVNESHPKVSISFRSVEFFSSDSEVRRSAVWQEFKNGTCLVIVDALSLLHPDVRATFIKSGIGNDKSPIVLMLPFGITALSTNRILEEKLHPHIQAHLKRFEEPDDEPLDALCAFGVAEPRSFRHWLASVLPATCQSVQKTRPTSEARKSVGNRVSTPKTGLFNAMMEIKK